MNQEIRKVGQQVTRVISRNSPTILTSLAVAGLVTTTVMAVRATPKALQILKMEQDYRADELLTKFDIVKLTWPYYAPSAVMGLVTIACIISANSINLRRNAALASVYSLAEASLKEYRSKVIETIGEKKERKIKDEIAKDKITKNPPKENEIILTGKGETLCYESLSGRYFKSDIEKIRKAENEINKEILNNNFISLNEVYDSLGLANTKMGDEVGWCVDDHGLVSFSFSSHLTEDGIPCLVVDYDIGPRYDFMDRW